MGSSLQGSKGNLHWGEACSAPKHGCHLRNTVSSWPYCPYLQSGERKVTDLWSHGAGVRHRWIMEAETFAKGNREGLLFHAWPLSLLFFKEALLSMVHKCKSSIQRMGHRGDQSLSSPSLASKETGFLPVSQGWSFCRHPPLATEPVVFGFHIQHRVSKALAGEPSFLQPLAVVGFSSQPTRSSISSAFWRARGI